MNKWWRVARQEFTTNVRRKGFLASVLGMPLLFIGGFLFAHHVDRPTSQLGAQLDILAIATDGLRQVFFRDGDVHRMSVFIHHDRSHFGWRHGIDDQLRRVVIPQDDVDTLIGQLAGHYLHA